MKTSGLNGLLYTKEYPSGHLAFVFILYKCFIDFLE